MFFKKDLGFSDEEIKKLTTLQVSLYSQRHMEPQYKQAIDSEIRNKQAERKSKWTRKN